MALDSPAKRLRFARERHGKYATPTDAARAFGWPVSTYLGHENGDRNPSRAAARRYGRAYHVRWEWILEGEGSPDATPPPVDPELKSLWDHLTAPQRRRAIRVLRALVDEREEAA